LAKVDSDHHIEGLSPEEYEKDLGEGSPEWDLWNLLDGQPGARS
jgi:hypothetical protein